MKLLFIIVMMILFVYILLYIFLPEKNHEQTQPFEDKITPTPTLKQNPIKNCNIEVEVKRENRKTKNKLPTKK